MQAVWKDPYTIRSYESSPSGNASIPSICNFFQESAWKHAEQIGLGFRTLADKKLYWVLSKFILTMNSLPEWGKTIEIRTWPKGKKRFYALRDFLLVMPDGTISAKATSAWIVINAETRGPSRLDFMEEILNYSKGESALDWDFPKIPIIKTSSVEVPIKVAYSDLDVNNHVNNVKYIEWILDVFYPAYPDKKIKTLEIHYSAEAVLHDTVTLSMSAPLKEDKMLFDCVRHKDGSTIFRGIITYC